MGEVTEIEARCVQFVRDCASGEWRSSKYRTITDSIEKRAQELVALLPEPIDPDLIEAREVIAVEYDKDGVSHLAKAARDGGGDSWFQMRIAREALARGRALATQATGHE